MNTIRCFKYLVKVPKKSFSKHKLDHLRQKYEQVSQPKAKKNFSQRYFYLGFACNLAFMAFLFISKESNNYSFSLSRAASRLAGKIASLNLPVFMRKPVFNLYISQYNVVKEDLVEEDLTKYPSIQAFFTREIKVSQ